MIRPDEYATIEGKHLTHLEDIIDEGWPDCIDGDPILAITRAGYWRVRGSLGGMAKWSHGEWLALRECPECGCEWWSDETPPLHGCCQRHNNMMEEMA